MTAQTKNKIDSFFTSFPNQQFKKGATVLYADSSEEYFFYIVEGAVKMMTTSRKGQSLVLHIFYPGSCFSLLSLINNGVNKYDFVTLLPTSLHIVPKKQLLSFLEKHNDVLFDFNQRLLQGLQGLLNRIEQSAFIPTYNQVAGLLLYFSHHHGKSNDPQNLAQQEITLRITHQEIADWLGISRENVSIQMKQLERDGFIRSDKKLFKIIDSEKLKEVANPRAMM